MKRLQALMAMFGLVLVGCGEITARPPAELSNETARPAQKAMRYRGESAKADMTVSALAPSPTRSMMGMAGMTDVKVTDGSASTLLALQPGAPIAAPTESSAIARKIIYDAQVALLVDSVDPAAKSVAKLVQNARGYIAEQSVTGSPGSPRAMHWRIRIPVEQFDAFVESIGALGELERNNRTSQDVTEQYYDVEARIKNKKLEEQTLNKILQERSGKLEDVLKIEVELSRVRGEIEQLEGKIRVLTNLSSLASLTLDIREREKYAPAAPVVASFPTQIGRTWDSSILNVQELGKSVVLWIVGTAIWIPFWIIGLIIAWIVLRRLVRAFIRNLPRIVAIARMPLSRPRAPSPSE
jgi:Domain of unknown function (DUF4349)